MRRADVLRIYLRTGETAEKLGRRIDELQGLFGTAPGYEDARQVAESLKVVLLEMMKGLDFMERRFRGESHDEAYNHAYNKQPNPVGGGGHPVTDPSVVEH